MRNNTKSLLTAWLLLDLSLYRDFLSVLLSQPYWGNHFWAPGYCVDTVGLDAEMIRKYVKYQETKERREEQLQFKF